MLGVVVERGQIRQSGKGILTDADVYTEYKAKGMERRLFLNNSDDDDY